ncbi:MAG: hypothetical protein ACR2OM_03375 [Aestuariivirgaceae bacterium]
MNSRFLLAGFAAMIVLPGLTMSDANADHRRHWFFDSYSQYEDEAFTYYMPERLLRQPGAAYEDPLRLYEEGYISEREYRRILRAERRKARRLKAKRRKAQKRKRWRKRVVRRDLSSDAKQRKRRQMTNVPLPRPRPLTEKPVETATLETSPITHEPVAIAPIKPTITPAPVESLAKEPAKAAPPETKPAKVATKPVPAKKAVINKDRKVKGRITCRSAEKIVAGFGFTDIEAKSCRGKSYNFSAQRDGKPFTIELSSANGELTQVKRN